MNSISKIIKNNTFIVISTVVLLAVILTVSLYYGLKESYISNTTSSTTSNTTSSTTSNTTSSTTSNPTSSPTGKLITFSERLVGERGAIIDLSKYNTKKINITINGIYVKDYISEGHDIKRNIFKVIKLLTGDNSGEENNITNYIEFSEIMNTKDRGLLVRSYSDKYGINSYHEFFSHELYEQNNYNYIQIILEQVDYYTLKYTYKCTDARGDNNTFEQNIVLNKVFSLENLKYLVINCNPIYYSDYNELERYDNYITYTVEFTNHN
jgi:hypothetical protein